MIKTFKDKFLFTEKIPNTKYARTTNIILSMIGLQVVMGNYSDMTYHMHSFVLIPFLTYVWAHNYIMIILLSNKEFFLDRSIKSRFISSTILVASIYYILATSIYLFLAFF